MTKPEYCKYCNSNNLTFVKENPIFDPDTEVISKINSWVCIPCNTIHVDNKDFSFIQRYIDSDKLLQTTNTNIKSEYGKH